MASSSPPYLTDWRNSFSLVPNNLQYCPKGKTFRGAHPSVETSGSGDNACITLARASGGTAKPGPTTDTSSRIARLKKLQTRTRTSTGIQSEGGTQRGAHLLFKMHQPELTLVLKEHSYLVIMEKVFQDRLQEEEEILVR